MRIALLAVILTACCCHLRGDDAPNPSLGATTYALAAKSQAVLQAVIDDEGTERYRRLFQFNRLVDLNSNLERFLPQESGFSRSWLAGTAFAWRSGGNTVDVIAIPGAGIDAIAAASGLELTPLGRETQIFQMGSAGLIIRPSEKEIAILSLWDGFRGKATELDKYLRQQTHDSSRLRTSADLVLTVFPNQLITKSTAQAIQLGLDQSLQRYDGEPTEVYIRRSEGQRIMKRSLEVLNEIDRISLSKSAVEDGQCTLELRICATTDSRMAKSFGHMARNSVAGPLRFSKSLDPSFSSTFWFPSQSLHLLLDAAVADSDTKLPESELNTEQVALVRAGRDTSRAFWFMQRVDAKGDDESRRLSAGAVGGHWTTLDSFAVDFLENPSALVLRYDSSMSLQEIVNSVSPPTQVDISEMDVPASAFFFARINFKTFFSSFFEPVAAFTNQALEPESTFDITGTIENDEMIFRIPLDESRLEVVYIAFEFMLQLAERVSQWSNLSDAR